MARNRDDTKLIFVHCSATRARQDIGVRTINKWHLQVGIYSDRGLSGYHFIVRRSGHIELGRDLAAFGAHALGFNEESVAICLVGGARKVKPDEQPDWGEFVAEDNFTYQQKNALEDQVRVLNRIYPEAALAPHYAVAPRACPSFDVWQWQQDTFGYNDELRATAIIEKIRSGGD